MNGDSEVVCELLKQQSVDVHAKNYDGCTSLILLCNEGHVMVVRELLMHKNLDANVNTSPHDGNALVSACQKVIWMLSELLKHPRSVDGNAANGLL